MYISAVCPNLSRLKRIQMWAEKKKVRRMLKNFNTDKRGPSLNINLLRTKL